MYVNSLRTIDQVSAHDLQASYVGQTKDRLNDLFKKAQGGVLFIDEAYSLGRGHFAREAQEQLIALCTSEDHLHKTVVILAGCKFLHSPTFQTRCLFTNLCRKP